MWQFYIFCSDPSIVVDLGYGWHFMRSLFNFCVRKNNIYSPKMIDFGFLTVFIHAEIWIHYPWNGIRIRSKQQSTDSNKNMHISQPQFIYIIYIGGLYIYKSEIILFLKSLAISKKYFYYLYLKMIKWRGLRTFTKN